MEMKHLYAVLCVLGTILPYSQFLPFFMENGMDLPLFVAEVFANNAASGIAFDALVTGLVVIAFMLVEGRRLKMGRLWLPILSIFAVGMSLGLPLFLYMRENALEREAS
jgi:hypothetical protein